MKFRWASACVLCNPPKVTGRCHCGHSAQVHQGLGGICCHVSGIIVIRACRCIRFHEFTQDDPPRTQHEER